MPGLLEHLRQEPRLTKLDKSGQELVLAFVEALDKQAGRRSGGADPIQGWEALAKANPGPGDVHVSSELTDLSVAYFQDQGNFLASSAGQVPVDRQSDAYMEYNRADLFRVSEDDAMRGPASESAGDGFDTTFPTYACKVYAWHKDVDEQLQANQRVGDPVDDALAAVVQKLLIIREKRWAATLFKTATWGFDLDGVPGAPGANQFRQWDQAAATPRKDISTYSVKIHEQTGMWPNTLAVQPYVLLSLLLAAEVVDAFKYTTAGATPTLAELAAALIGGASFQAAPPRILLVGGIATTSNKGAADAVGYIGGKHALLAHVAPRSGLRTPSAWYCFSWAGLLGANALGARIKDFDITERAITHRVEGEMAFDHKLVSSLLGTFFESAVA